MTDTLLFFKKFLRHGTRIASVVPSSRFLAEKMLFGIDWNTTDPIVELGAGTGPFTEALVAHARPDRRIVAIERDADFVDVLRRKFRNVPNVEIVHGNALDLPEILKKHGVNGVMHIVSGLPIPSFSNADRDMFFSAIGAVLLPDGRFHQLTVLPLLYKSLYKRYFSSVRFLFEPRNVPPAGVCICAGPIMK